MDASFRAIIVGGGLIGLLAAHILAKAKIDFVLLERCNTLFPEHGASIGVYPQTVRVFDQLGLLEPLQKIWDPLTRKLVLTHSGYVFKDHPRFTWMRDNHGHPFAMTHRNDLLRCLYDNLDDNLKDLVHLNKKVVDIQVIDDACELRCSDGTTECGSIIIGADGNTSRVRQQMRHHGQPGRPLLPLVTTERPFEASFTLLYGSGPVLPGMPVGTSWEAHGKGMSTALFVGEERAWFFLYEKQDFSSQSALSKTSLSKEDEARFVSKWAHVHITDTIRLKDVYEARWSSGMTLAEEGLVEHRYSTRIVLVGDSAAKVTPNLAFGLNGGVQGLVALMNGLHSLVRRQHVTNPSTEELDAVFQTYQDQALPLSRLLVDISGESLRATAWDTWNSWVMDRYVNPVTGADWTRYNKHFAPMIARSLVLDFLAERNLPCGKMEWQNHPEMATGL
ncbi:monooxygenase [Apiospora arundinis]|uniref:Monooxygenase n=1 Tax=Apiospora arundinis TaxID=335852 RepID=A0ABR2HRV9_9PEZI